MDAMLARLAEPYTRARIRQKLVESGVTNFGRLQSWADIRIANSPTAEAGRTIDELARERDQDPLDVACDVIIADRGATRILVRSMSEDDVKTTLADPLVMVGSDGPCVAPYGITGQGKPHPRLYGTFPRVLGHYARDLHIIGLPQAVYKMAGGAAAALGLADRGTISEGKAADLVLFDPQTVADRASFDEPHQYPVGIETVIVNGVATTRSLRWARTRSSPACRSTGPVEAKVFVKGCALMASVRQAL
jgi:N-acyl-D-amino-acid deacylase